MDELTQASKDIKKIFILNDKVNIWTIFYFILIQTTPLGFMYLNLNFDGSHKLCNLNRVILAKNLRNKKKSNMDGFPVFVQNAFLLACN